MFFVGLIAELGGDVAGFVEESHAALQFGEQCVIAADVNGGGHAEVFLDDADEIAVEIPVFDPIVVAIADENVVVPWIVGDAMAGLELSFGFARSAEGFHEFAVFVELEDVIGTVAIGDENRAVRCNCNGAGIEPLRIFEDFGFGGVIDGLDVFPG